MVRIRLQRVGLKKQPSYRIVVLDKRRKRDGGIIENIGNHNPRTRPETNNVNHERALYWLSVGAQPSDAVRRVLEAEGTWTLFERFRDGESIEDLIEEFEQQQAEIPEEEEEDPQSGKTSFPAPGPGESKIKARTEISEEALEEAIEGEE